MAESSTSEKSINRGSDQVPGQYCEPCQDISGEMKPVAGYCLDCDESLCQECYDFHLRRKLFRNHQLVDKSTRPKANIQPQQKHKDLTEKCPRHHGETLQLFCKSHSELCCKVCITIKHKSCVTEEISKMARNIKTSGQPEDLCKKLSMLKTGFNENLSKAKTNEELIQKNYTQAMDKMKELSDEFEKKMTETENQAERVKEEDLKQSQTVTEGSSMIIDQINKITANLDNLKDKSDNETIFIAMKRAEYELQAFEGSLIQLEGDNSVREYTFEPDMKLNGLISQLKVLGCLSFLSVTQASTSKVVSLSQQMAKKPSQVKDINASDTNLTHHGSVVLPNEKLLITEYTNKKVKLIETSNGTIVSEIQLSGTPVSMTKVKTEELAVTLQTPNKIQFVILSQDKLSLGREILVNEQCFGIAYNDKDKTFILTVNSPAKVEIINMAGSVVRTIQTDSNQSNMFSSPYAVTLTPPEMSGMYVSDNSNRTVTSLSLSGDVQTVYKGNGLQGPIGICVHKSGVVYLADYNSSSVHLLDPYSGEFKLLLGQKDGLSHPYSISYCDTEDKMYVGMFDSSLVKVFEMK